MMVKKIEYSSIENLKVLPSKINVKHNRYEQRHLELDGKSVKIVSDGFCDRDKEIQSELKNSGLQNILRMQEMRYGTLENAIARAQDRGVYADISDIPDNIGDRAEYIQKVNESLAQLKKELGLTDDDLKSLNADKIIELYEKKNKPVTTTSEEPTEGGK